MHDKILINIKNLMNTIAFLLTNIVPNDKIIDRYYCLLCGERTNCNA